MTTKKVIGQSHREQNHQSGGSLKLSDPEIKVKISSKGTSGTNISGGRFFEEYLDKLTSTDGPLTWDEMRRSDDQVIMLLRVVKNPIMSARWYISPADDSPEQKEIADFIEHVLFNNMGCSEFPKPFEKFKREALTCIEFGFSVFEITNKIEFNHSVWGTYIGLKGLDWRNPKTIEEWRVDREGRLCSILQIDNSENGGIFEIPGKFVLHIAPEMEGDNYEGISMLRPIYGNWLRKDVLRKLQMIGIERAATGVPIGTVPVGQENTPSQTVLEESLSRFVSHERQYIITPEGYEVDSLKIDHDAEKVQSAIEAENVGMAKSFLANFMELGLNGTGSYALGTDLSDIFLSGIEVYANSVKTAINDKLIPALVRMNIGVQEHYPTLEIEGINDKAGEEFAKVLQILGESGLLQVTEKLKTAIHKKFNLPDYDPDAIEIKKLLPEKETIDSPNLSEIEYSLAEKNLSVKIKSVGEQLSKDMKISLTDRATKYIKGLIKIWKNETRSKRMQSANDLPIPGKNDYKKMLSSSLSEIYVDATRGVKSELNLDGLNLAEPTPEDISELPAESKAAVKSQADLLVESQDADIRKTLLFSFTSNADKLPTDAQMEANLIRVVNAYLNGPSINAAGANAVANAVNLARNAIYQKKETLDAIESFIFMNPSPEAPICKELAGRVFTKEEYIISDKLPPLHHHCNSWIKAQVMGRKGNKNIDPIGLSITGDSKEIEKKLNSIRF